MNWYCIMYNSQSFIMGRRDWCGLLQDRKLCFEPIEDEL